MGRKLTTLTLGVVLSIPFQANAIYNGTLVNRADFQQFVEMGCTGNIIGGKWVLTAAHCVPDSGLRNVVMYDDSLAETKSHINHPSYDGTFSDISLWELKSVQDVNQINTISVDPVGAGESITVYGFGRTAPELSKAVQTSEAISGDAQWLRTIYTSQGESIYGDSGASYLNSAGQIVGVHNRGSSTSTWGMQGYRTETGRDFILDTVNGWHYPTNLDITTSATITVQSLHVGGTSDTAYTTGDLSINHAASTCDDGTIGEFETCTYSVTTSGGEGQLYLSASEKINVNKPVVSDSNNATSDNNGGGEDGGSFGLLSLLSLLGFSVARKKGFRQ